MCLTCPQKVSMLVQRQESISCRPLWMAESKNAENGIFINTYFNETEAHPLDHCNKNFNSITIPVWNSGISRGEEGGGVWATLLEPPKIPLK